MKSKSVKHFKLSARDPDRLMTGGNCRLEIDGVEVQGAKSFSLRCDAKGVGVATIEYYGCVEAQGLLEVEENK